MEKLIKTNSLLNKRIKEIIKYVCNSDIDEKHKIAIRKIAMTKNFSSPKKAPKI